MNITKEIWEIEVEREVNELYPGVSALSIGVKTFNKKDYNLDKALKQVASKIGYNLDNLKDIPKIRAYRDFYWRMGIDPTKQRPASEALVRRLLSKGSIPKISFIVDAGNLASIETLIPIGIYDTRFIKGPLRLRLAREGEVFVDITGKERKLGKRDIVLSDNEGPLHVFPYRDSFRTRVREDTEEVYVVACGVKGIEKEDLKEALERVCYWLRNL